MAAWGVEPANRIAVAVEVKGGSARQMQRGVAAEDVVGAVAHGTGAAVQFGIGGEGAAARQSPGTRAGLAHMHNGAGAGGEGAAEGGGGVIAANSQSIGVLHGASASQGADRQILESHVEDRPGADHQVGRAGQGTRIEPQVTALNGRGARGAAVRSTE